MTRHPESIRPAAWRWAFRLAVAWSMVSLVAVVVAAMTTESGEPGGLAGPALLVFLILSALSFGLRLVRWHRLVLRLAPGLPLRDSAVIGTIGFALTITPGRVGELLKFRLVEEATGRSLWNTTPVALVEKMAEAGAFLVLIALSAVALGAGRAGALDLGALDLGALALSAMAALAVILVLLMLVRLAAYQVVPRLEGGSGWTQRAQQLTMGLATISGPRDLLPAVALGVMARSLDVLALTWLLGAMGHGTGWAGVMLAFSASGLAAGLSFLPGGLGIAEAGLVGALAGFGVAWPAALTASLLSRAGSVWIWIILGLILGVRFRVSSPESRVLGVGD